LNPARLAYRLANSPLVSQILFTNNGVRRMITTRQFDALNRLTRVASLGGTASTLSSRGETGSIRVYLGGNRRNADCQSAVSRIANPQPHEEVSARRLPVGETAGCQPALPGCGACAVVVPARCARSTLSPAIASSFWPYQYDALGRRIRQTTSDGSSGSWQVTEDLRLVSDPVLFGRHIAELRASDNALVRSYVWGLDLSGGQAGPATMQGAGGVGGLLWMTQHTGPDAGMHFAAYDGNGNIVALSAVSDGSESARYEYGPFGEPIRVTGPAATLNPFRFSTKRTDNTTDFVLYEWRIYIPSLGRWLSRDPIGEKGGMSLYDFVSNNSVSSADSLGLVTFRFEVIVGKWRGYSGVWSQPWYAGDGSYVIADYFASSTVNINNRPHPWWPWPSASYCNSVDAGNIFDSTAAHCGTINVYANDPCGGTFHISGLYTAIVSGSGPEGGYGHAWLYSGSGGVLSHVTAIPQSPVPMAIALISEDVKREPKKEKLVVRYEPYIDIPHGELTYATATGTIFINK